MEVQRQISALKDVRSYHKNDNAHVEQKNFTHVRELFGYERIENEALVSLMNEIYRDYWNPLHNFFLPQMQLKLEQFFTLLRKSKSGIKAA